MIKVFQLTIFIIFFSSVFSDPIVECNVGSDERFDHIVRELTVFGDPTGKYPSDDKEMAEGCQNDRVLLNWAQTYIKTCLQGFAQQLSALFMHDYEVVSKKYCDSPKLSKMFVSWGKCGTAALNSTVKCWDTYIDQLERVNKNKTFIPDSDKVLLTCCYYYQFDQCIEDSFVTLGTKVCPTAIAEGLHTSMTEVSGRLVQILCGEYQADNDKCDNILVKYEYLKGLVLKRPLRKSPIHAMVSIINNTPESLKFMAIDYLN